jgi:hypothetical protein
MVEEFQFMIKEHQQINNLTEYFLQQFEIPLKILSVLNFLISVKSTLSFKF